MILRTWSNEIADRVHTTGALSPSQTRTLLHHPDPQDLVNMCFYAITDFCCGDWRWGNMKERCPHEHRIGETCGTKLIHPDHITKTQSPCKFCCSIAAKERQLRRLDTRIARWSLVKDEFPASLEKAWRQKDENHRAIGSLQSKRTSVVACKHTGRAQMKSEVHEYSTFLLPPTQTRSVSKPLQCQAVSRRMHISGRSCSSVKSTACPWKHYQASSKLCQ